MEEAGFQSAADKARGVNGTPLTKGWAESVDAPRIATERLASIDWDFPESGSRGRVHDLHPYPARFIPEIPRALIQLFHPGEGAYILDPFCGSGTSLVEAVMAGLPAVGIDLNPLAVLIAKVKTTPLSQPIASLAADMASNARCMVAQIPAIPALDHWFMPEVQEALSALVNQINHVEEERSRDALRVALSRIIVRVSNQDSDTRYAAVQKQVSRQDVLDGFVRSAEFVERALAEAYGGLFPRAPSCRLIEQDVLTVSARLIGNDPGLVITSPPYPNAYEYWLYHKYRMYWLGMDPLRVREAEIGARPHYFKKNGHTEVHFEQQMATCFELLANVMKPGGIACFLVGRSIIHGKEIDNATLLERAAAGRGFRLLALSERRIRKSRKTFNPSIGAIEKEQLLVLARVAR